MAVVSDDITIVLAVWAALEANPDFAQVKLGNRIKQTLKQAEGVRCNPESKPAKQAGDMVEVDIDVGALTSSVVMPTFGSCTRDEACQQAIIITIQTDEMGIRKSSEIKQVVLNSLRTAGRTLGIPKATLPIKNWQVVGGQNTKDKPAQMTGGQQRREVKMTLSVTYHKKS